MLLHEMKRPNIRKHKKRLGKGQGSGTGKTAGKGHKGQKSRSGGNIPVWFEGGQMPIHRRLPKKGFKNLFRVEYRILNLEKLADADGTDFDVAALEEQGLIKKVGKNKNVPVKILAKAENFTKKVNIKANAFSKRAKELIEKNGGKAEVV
ncbi:MAG: 50S ribosomal protein L15 [Candidatus Cloacimonadota bacterium]|nr:ribosomal protein L15 [uncultured bacterium]PID30074.1 MAG: 50S ribosomal protein L15 [Candidatus Cloacimonadota bacterium]